MKRLSLSLAVVILALSSAVSASDFEEDKQYISCRKGVNVLCPKLFLKGHA